jgi:FAD/FMN-containing dehydrogenase
MSVRNRLRSLLDEDRFVAPTDRAPDRDIASYPLGAPVCWVRPRSTAEVVRVVEVARDTRTPVVAVGRRTAYWRPIAYEGAIVVDTGSLDHIVAVEPGAEHVWCGAGTSVRTLLETVAAAGGTLAIEPDGFGETSVGSMVAVDTRAGIGMGLGTVEDLVGGLRVVLGSGSVLTTGAAAALGADPFTRAGLPDVTPLFFASDGALGIVTEVAVRIAPRFSRALLHWSFDPDHVGWRGVIDLARTLRGPGLYTTFRAAAENGAGRVDLVLTSPFDDAELDARIARTCDRIREVSQGSAVDVERASAEETKRLPPWLGDPGEHWERLAGTRFVGVDVIAPWRAIDPCMVTASRLAERASSLPHRSIRHAVYFAPGYVNLGVHCAFEPEAAGAADAVVDEGIRWMSELGVVPYRWGRLWGGTLGPRLDATYAKTMQDLARVLDPDGILHPGATIFGAGT